MANIDMRRLTVGELIAVCGALILFFSMFINWYHFFPGGTFTTHNGMLQVHKATHPPGGENAWQAFSVLHLFLAGTVIVAVGLAIVTVTQRSLTLPIAASILTTLLGVISIIGIGFRIIDLPGDNALANPELGAYLGLAAAAIVALGGWRTMHEEGYSLHDARHQIHGFISGSHRHWSAHRHPSRDR